MDDDKKLFMNNPLKALFVQNKEIIDILKRITQELDEEGISNNDLDSLDKDNFKEENFYGD